MRAIAIVSLLAIGAWARGESRAEHDARTSVKVYVVRGVSDGGLNVPWATSIASHIFAEAGVHVKWQLAEPRRGERDNAIIVDLTSDTPDTLDPGALAYAQVFEGVHIRIFWDRVEKAVMGADRLRTFLLAHVMAHEIAHIIEGVDRHSETGLMKASWTKKEIEEMSVRSLSLAPEDVRLIQQVLLK